MMPYYIDIPELELPAEILNIPYAQHPMDFLSPSGKGLGGDTFQYRAVPTNWHSIIKSLLDSKVNIKFGSITLLNTGANGSSPWHSEGPNMFGRQCALNFMMSGDFENSYVQWCKKDESDIRTNDTTGAWWEHDDMEILSEHRMTPTKATIYNTMHWHRVFNFTSQNRIVISAAINIPIEDVYELYISGTLFK
jgi:hypothetical protein